ncbi:alpha/beta fold hydrolase [Gracilimonas sp.]|uniref:alpha/beta fold hydrolase n=1 Tax=Gracilimonas sp. TaxID=1974203 RepID=UPI0028729EC2|nr:alpha/beta hydrolase [Gracilimonas sp.]
MADNIFKNKTAQNRMENWYQQFLDRANVETESVEVSTSFGSSHVLTAGDRSKPSLICLHAMMTSSAHLLSELARLLDHFYIIAPDLPGQSVKGLPKKLPYSDNSHAIWLQELLDGLNLEKVHLLGISLGGFVARQFASSNPKKVKSLVLIVPAGIVQGSLVKGFTKMALPMIKYKIRPSEKNLRNFVGHLITTWDEDWAKYLGDAFNDFNPNLKIPPLASKEELENLTMPCLVIGAEDDISFPGDKVIDRVKAHVPHVEAELLKGSKHSPPTTPEFRNWLATRIKSFVS